ncbi:MAG: hypothetical protein P0Y53_10725 [Candidatus Pseudobacter hemicellulosilyticus]|uniref:Secreted protein with PEP-CTERM sorting signal n=1 Tax=Candidatus Pseudobacter hemicellulosilyticus TaxID=3121375 RepID=A0AAJ5WWR5_9BACT|nr:MAG: hypothetical protein P0Y53_10725 [Pseudobacter sp.]
MKKAITMLACCLPLLTFAHHGEGAHEHTDGGFTIFHYFIAKEHAIITWPMVILAVVALYLHYRKKKTASGKSPSDHA